MSMQYNDDHWHALIKTIIERVGLPHFNLLVMRAVIEGGYSPDTWTIEGEEHLRVTLQSATAASAPN
jgi:hypothetical protein